MADPGAQDRDTTSTAGQVGGLIQGVLLDRLMIGLVLMGLIDVVAAFSEASGVARVGVLLIGVVAIVVPVISWRAKWSDRLGWAVGLLLLVLVFAGFAWAVA